MILTEKQIKAIEISKQRIKNKEDFTCIAGYAGSGKTFLVRILIDSLNLSESEVVFISYTGKASLVLRNMGCKNSMTSHKLLYNSILKKDGTFVHQPKDIGELRRYKLIIVDEVSMLPDEIWKLLLKHKIPIIALGDPFQLPPIGSDNRVLYRPHIFLDEIMRQDADSEIVDLTLKIRENKTLPLFKGADVQVLPKSEFKPSMLFWANQVICGKNETRNKLNLTMRKMKYGKDTTYAPIEGDKIICLKNSWDTCNGLKEPLVNGMIGTASNIWEVESFYYGIVYMGDFIPETSTSQCENFNNLMIDRDLLLTGNPSRILVRNKTRIKYLQQFDYGYAITCHKSQGSQWDNVLVFEETLRSDWHARWLYTAATRASKKLIVIKEK